MKFAFASFTALLSSTVTRVADSFVGFCFNAPTTAQQRFEFKLNCCKLAIAKTIEAHATEARTKKLLQTTEEDIRTMSLNAAEMALYQALQVRVRETLVVAEEKRKEAEAELETARTELRACMIAIRGQELTLSAAA